jgi:excisionase family DNA binding protein
MTARSEFDSQCAGGVRHNDQMAVDALPHPRDDDFQLLTATEAAELIRLPRSSLYELARNRRIPFVRIGRRIFFVRTALVQWVIDEMSVPPRRREPRPRVPTRA